MTHVVIGIDLAWSARNRTGLAALEVTESSASVLTTTTASRLDEVVDFVRRYASRSITVAIDAPTIVPNEEGMRPVERTLQRLSEFHRLHAGPYPANRRLLGKHNGGRPRGEELVDLLGKELGVCEVGCPEAGHAGSFAMEVFPSGAMARLFGRTFPYKKKQGRSWDDCRAALTALTEAIHQLTSPPVRMPTDLRVEGQAGKNLKELEDRLDAVVCAYVGALAWLGKAEMLGDLKTGYIVLPKRRDRVEADDQLDLAKPSATVDAAVSHGVHA